MIVFVGSDHNGFFMKKAVIDYLKKRGIQTMDVGDDKLDTDDDFPVFVDNYSNLKKYERKTKANTDSIRMLRANENLPRFSILLF